MENNRTEQENNKMTFPNEEGQDEWGTQQERKSGGGQSQMYTGPELSERTFRGQGKDSKLYTLVGDGVVKRLELRELT